MRFRNPFRAHPDWQDMAEALQRKLGEEKRKRASAELDVQALQEQLATAREVITDLRRRNRGLELHHAHHDGTIERVDSEVAVEAAQNLRKMVLAGEVHGGTAHAVMDIADMLDATFADRQQPDRTE